MGDIIYTFVKHVTTYRHYTMFACITSDIEKAGDLCEKEVGINPWKTKYVGCNFVSRYTYL